MKCLLLVLIFNRTNAIYLSTNYIPSTEIFKNYNISLENVVNYIPSTNELKSYITSVKHNIPSSDILISYTPSSEIFTKYIPSSNMLRSYISSSDIFTKYIPSHEKLISYIPSSNTLIGYIPSSDTFTKYIPSSGILTSYIPSGEIFINYIPSKEDIYNQANKICKSLTYSVPGFIIGIPMVPGLIDNLFVGGFFAFLSYLGYNSFLFWTGFKFVILSSFLISKEFGSILLTIYFSLVYFKVPEDYIYKTIETLYSNADVLIGSIGILYIVNKIYIYSNRFNISKKN